MAETEFQSVTLDDGTVVEARINRRGCTGAWTEEAATHMAALIKAVAEQHRRSKPDPSLSTAATTECRECDGCGWYEGGRTLKTTCEACAGTGVVPSSTSSKP